MSNRVVVNLDRTREILTVIYTDILQSIWADVFTREFGSARTPISRM